MDAIEQHESDAIAELEVLFLQALDHKNEGRLDRAEDIFRDLIAKEPRLPEPHLELARILLDTDRLEDAQLHATEALTHLENGGQWNDTIPESVMLGLAHAVLAETLRRRADEDDMIFGDPEAFKALIAQAHVHFAKAAELDPDDSYSSYHAFFLGDPRGLIKLDDLDASPSEAEDDEG